MLDSLVVSMQSLWLEYLQKRFFDYKPRQDKTRGLLELQLRLCWVNEYLDL